MNRGLYRVEPPVETDSVLAERMAGRNHWLLVGGPVPRNADAITIAGLVVVRRRCFANAEFARLLRHEQVHVAQFRELGFVGFLQSYISSYLGLRVGGAGAAGAYWKIPLEVEARSIAQDVLVSAELSATCAAACQLVRPTRVVVSLAPRRSPI